jgi:hypothetical protein
MNKPKKARNATEEKEIREGLEADSVKVEYMGILERVEKARDMAASEYFQKGFQHRSQKVSSALTRLQEAAKKMKVRNLDTVKDCADVKKESESLRKAVEDKDLYCADIKFDVAELKSFCIGHTIFRQTAGMTKTADFNNELGIVEMKENK